MVKKAAAPAAKKKAGYGERKATKKETESIDRLAKGRKLAAGYLVKRDGLELEMATMVVDGMEPADIDALIVESNDKAIEEARAAGILPPKGEGEEKQVIDFSTVPLLVSWVNPEDEDQTFTILVAECAAEAAKKNAAEARYKLLKKMIVELLDAATGAPAYDSTVDVFGTKLARYQGHHITLSEQKMLEQSIAPETIQKCKVDTPYEDVRITPPKGA